MLTNTQLGLLELSCWTLETALASRDTTPHLERSLFGLTLFLKFLTVIEQGSPTCFHFVLGNSLSHFYYSYLNQLLSKNFRGRVTWETFWDYGMEGFLSSGAAAPGWMVEDDGPGVMVRASAEWDCRQANLGGPSPQEGGIILLKYRQNWGTEQKLLQLQTYQQSSWGLSETLIRAPSWSRRNGWMRGRNEWGVSRPDSNDVPSLIRLRSWNHLTWFPGHNLSTGKTCVV